MINIWKNKRFIKSKFSMNSIKYGKYWRKGQPFLFKKDNRIFKRIMGERLPELYGAYEINMF